MKLISWNVAGRVRGLDNQVAALAQRRPDVLALQEIRRTTAARFHDELSRIGLPYGIDSFALSSNSERLVGPRQYGELIASRWPIRSLPPEGFPVPWTERVLSALIESPCGAIELHTTHIPPGASNGWIKIEMLEGIFARLACESQRPRLLCGDFNTPQEEMLDGTIVTWGQWKLPDGRVAGDGTWRDPHGREDTNARWDMGERNVLEGLSRYDLQDVYRLLHGYARQDFSHYVHRKIGRRFDHVFASRSLNAVNSEYLHSFREGELSDHSPIEVIFEPVQ